METKPVQCECGFEARGLDDDSLVVEIRRHAREAHGMELSLEDALVLAFRAELGQARPSAIAQKAGTQEEGE